MTIIALAGRRIDAPDATVPRFPPDRAEKVQAHLRELLRQRTATALIASGACGADLLALQVAADEHIDCRLVLPFARQRFREISVTDRPGDWGSLFDRIYATAKGGNLGVKTFSATKNQAYDFIRTNRYLISEALRLAKEVPKVDILAVIVWDGKSRGPDDMTAGFAELARAANIPVHTILTLP